MRGLRVGQYAWLGRIRVRILALHSGLGPMDGPRAMVKVVGRGTPTGGLVQVPTAVGSVWVHNLDSIPTH